MQWSDGNTDNPRILTVTTNATYTAQFALNTYTLTALSNNSTMGTVLGGGTYPHNTPVYITAMPNHGYHFVQWMDSVTDNPRLVTMTANATYTAQFDFNTYTLTVISGNSTYGTVTGSGIYNYNTTAVITATPYYGYHFVQWNDGNTDNPRTVVVTENTGYTAQFAVNNYLVTGASNSTSAGTVTGGGSFNYLSTATLTALPAPHHHFMQWSDGITLNPRSLTVVSDTLLTAIFVIDSHLVTAAAADTLQGYVTGSGNVAYGSSIYLTAVPAYGYYFTAWSDGNTQNPRPVTITSDTTFTAIFHNTQQFNLQVTASDDAMGTVTGGGTYYASDVTITATPNPGHRFNYWNSGDGSTVIATNPLTVHLATPPLSPSLRMSAIRRSPCKSRQQMLRWAPLPVTAATPAAPATPSPQYPQRIDLASRIGAQPLATA